MTLVDTAVTERSDQSARAISVDQGLNDSSSHAFVIRVREITHFHLLAWSNYSYNSVIFLGESFICDNYSQIMNGLEKFASSSVHYSLKEVELRIEKYLLPHRFRSGRERGGSRARQVASVGAATTGR